MWCSIIGYSTPLYNLTVPHVGGTGYRPSVLFMLLDLSPLALLLI